VVQLKSPSAFGYVVGRTGLNAEDSVDRKAALTFQSQYEIGVKSKFFPEFKPKSVEKLNFTVYRSPSYVAVL